MEGYIAIIYLTCLMVLLILGKFFYLPLKRIGKLLINITFGGVAIYIINLVGNTYGFHLGLNWGTAIYAGVLGIPRTNIINSNKINTIKALKYILRA